MNPATVEIADRYTTHDLINLEMEAVDQLIARVLGQAHRAAIAVGAPAEARVILDVAQAFADELATAVSEFDRLAFLHAVIEDRS